MAQRKKNRSKDNALQKLIFATAILNLVKALIDLIKSLTGQGERGIPPLTLKNKAFPGSCQDDV